MIMMISNVITHALTQHKKQETDTIASSERSLETNHHANTCQNILPMPENPSKQQIPPKHAKSVLRGYLWGKYFHRGRRRIASGKQTYLFPHNTQADNL